jgi:hypothetical protein
MQGEPMTVAKFSNLMCQFAKRHLGEEGTINTSDLSMSLALKYMLVNKKTHSEMATEKRYFKNIFSVVYKEIFDTFANEKFPKLYKDFIEYFVELKKSLNM